MINIHGLFFGAADRGMRLPARMLQRMEHLFGHSFADVRVHLSAQPMRLGKAAFVHGSDIYIDPGYWAPDSAEGWARIGHELAHVRQARRGWRLAPEGVGVRVLDDPALEAEAEHMAALARDAFHPQRPIPAMRRAPRALPHRWDLVLV